MFTVRTKPNNLGRNRGTGSSGVFESTIGRDGRLEELVVKLGSGCPYSICVGRISGTHPVVISGGWLQVPDEDGKYARGWLPIFNTLLHEPAVFVPSVVP